MEIVLLMGIFMINAGYVGSMWKNRGGIGGQSKEKANATLVI